MTGDVDDVIDTAGDPVVTVLVAARAIAGEILAGEGGEIGLDEALVIAVDGPHHARPRLGDAEIAFGRALAQPAFAIDDDRLDAEERPGRRTRLQGRCAGQRRYQDAAGFRLPPGVDDRRALVADDIIVPKPCFRIDRLADRAEEAQRFAARSLDVAVALAHQRADRRRGRVEDVDFVLVDDLPEARRVGVVRYALEHQRRRAVGERAVENIAVPGHPADIGGAPIDIAVVIIEDVLMRHRGEDEIAASGVQYPLWLAGRARGVEDKEGILGAHLLRRTVARDRRGGLVIPDVAALDPTDIAAGMAHDDDRRDRWTVHQRRIGVGLERYLAAAAQPLVGGDQNVRIAVLDAAHQAVRREAAEDHRMDGADTRAGEHRVSDLGDHWQVDGDAVAPLDAARLQDVGEAADILVQLGIADVALLVGAVAFPDDRRLVGTRRQMAVDAVVAGVERAVLVPADLDVAREVGVLDPRVGLHPVQALAFLAPELLGVAHRLLVFAGIAGFVDPGRAGKRFGDRQDATHKLSSTIPWRLWRRLFIGLCFIGLCAELSREIRLKQAKPDESVTRYRSDPVETQPRLPCRVIDPAQERGDQPISNLTP